MARQLSDDIRRGPPISLTVDGESVTAYAGETLAAVLLAEQTTAFNRTRSGEPRAPFCNMGTCFECQVQVAAPDTTTFRWLRACVTPALDGMAVRTGGRLQAPESSRHAD